MELENQHYFELWQDIHGEARPLSGIKIGYLEQEPKLDESKDVRGNVEKGVAEATTALKRLNKLFEEYAEPEADFDALAKEQADLENIIQALDAHTLNIDWRLLLMHLDYLPGILKLIAYPAVSVAG